MVNWRRLLGFCLWVGMWCIGDVQASDQSIDVRPALLSESDTLHTSVVRPVSHADGRGYGNYRIYGYGPPDYYPPRGLTYFDRAYGSPYYKYRPYAYQPPVFAPPPAYGFRHQYRRSWYPDVYPYVYPYYPGSIYARGSSSP